MGYKKEKVRLLFELTGPSYPNCQVSCSNRTQVECNPSCHPGHTLAKTPGNCWLHTTGQSWLRMGSCVKETVQSHQEVNGRSGCQDGRGKAQEYSGEPTTARQTDHLGGCDQQDNHLGSLVKDTPGKTELPHQGHLRPSLKTLELPALVWCKRTLPALQHLKPKPRAHPL